jgi:hypothetical protein
MSQARWHVKPSEVQRMLEMVKRCGLNVTAVEVTPAGAIKISVTEKRESDAETPEELKKLL